MLQKLEAVAERLEVVEAQLADPAIVTDHTSYTPLAREHAELAPLVAAYRDHQQATAALREAREALDDPELRELAREEIPDLEARLDDLEARLRDLLTPSDPLDARDVLLEVRAGTGGDEAAIFAGDLFEMYRRHATQRGWRVEVLSASAGPAGGYKELIALVSGARVYSHLKYEAGVHRVQRVPATESQGRIHTSACTVAVLPEAEEVEVELQPADLEIDRYRASGAGGQHVNTTDSAVRITHKPTGLVVTSQDERSQHRNLDSAMRVLRSRLLDRERTLQQRSRAEERRSMVGSGDRSERIRTYNYPQNRITDHRIQLTLYSLDRVVGSGDLDELIDALRAHEEAERLRRGADGRGA